MLSLKKKSAVFAVAAGLTLGLAACGQGDDQVAAPSTPSVPSVSSAPSASAASKAPSASPSPVAALTTLTGKQTAVTLDKDFVAALTSLKVKPGTTGRATLDAATGKAAFPITGGSVTYYKPDSGVEPFVQGLINHQGSGLSLTGGGKVVKLENFEVDPEMSMLFGKVTVDGMVAFERAPLFLLDGSTLKPLAVNAGSNTAVLEGAGVSLTKEAAGALNMVFGITDLKEGLEVGIAEITLALPKS